MSAQLFWNVVGRKHRASTANVLVSESSRSTRKAAKKKPAIGRAFQFPIVTLQQSFAVLRRRLIIDDADSRRIVPVPGVVIAVFRWSLELGFGDPAR
jgi:hypothetical protein